VNGGGNRPHQEAEEAAAMTHVREGSRFGPCYVLGELIGETGTRYIYRNRAGTAFVGKSAPLIHLEPFAVCGTYHEREAAA
jgi:hypothetical protein